jgi:hypothetical protein
MNWVLVNIFELFLYYMNDWHFYKLWFTLRSRNQLGVRLTIRGQQQLEFLQKWNPWSKSIPWLTMTSHPLLINSSHSNRTNYDINDFNCSLIQALKQDSNKSDHNICQVLYKPIIIENYANLVSAVHNITNLGFFKSRGKFSF